MTLHVALSNPLAFSPGKILGGVADVQMTLPPGTGLLRSLIFGTSTIDPMDLSLVQVTLKSDGWRRELVPPGESVPFPVDRGFSLAFPGFNEIDQIARSLATTPVRIIVRVRIVRVRRSPPAARSNEPALFRLVLLRRPAEREEAS